MFFGFRWRFFRWLRINVRILFGIVLNFLFGVCFFFFNVLGCWYMWGDWGECGDLGDFIVGKLFIWWFYVDIFILVLVDLWIVYIGLLVCVVMVVVLLLVLLLESFFGWFKIWWGIWLIIFGVVVWRFEYIG